MCMRLLPALLIFLSFTTAHASGIYEIGVSASGKRANIAKDAYDESASLTGSISYYFMEMSALELSYTDGINRRVVGSGSTTEHRSSLFYTMVGLDLVVSFGPKEADFRPYIKAGAAYIIRKQLSDQYIDASGPYPTTTVEDPPTVVPSAGVGARVSLSKSFALKFGIDMWVSRPLSETPIKYDYAGRIGLSMYL